MRMPRLNVIYGRSARFSTSFQTRQFSRALRSWFDIRSFPLADHARSRWLELSIRFLHNTALPLTLRSRSHYLLYTNDGFVDFRRCSGIRLLYWYDAPADWSQSPPPRIQRTDWLRFQNVIAADHLFAVSRAQCDLARRLRPGRESSVTYLPVGVDCREFDPNRSNPETIRKRFQIPGRTVVGYLGYLGAWNNRFAGQMLVEAAARLGAAVNDLHFLIVGFGPALETFQRSVAHFGLSDRFTFTGFVASEDLPHCLAAMDVCIDTLEPGFHSEARSETKLKQYMAMGRACVATDVGENRVDLDNGRCGCLVPPGVDELARGIKSLVHDPDRRAEFGRTARQRAETVYHWPRLAERLAASLGMMEPPAGPRPS